MTTIQAWPRQHLFKAEPTTLIWSDPLPDAGRMVVKMYRRRAFYDPIRRWLLPYRAEREFELLAHMHQRGIPCPEPLWWSHGSNRAHGRHELLATREITGCKSLKSLLQVSVAAPLPDLTPLFFLARRMHGTGISHGAFFPSNILVSMPLRHPPEYHVLDLAHGCRFSRNIVGTRPAEFDLLDMLRAIEKQQPLKRCVHWLAGYGLGETGTAKFLQKLDGHRIERPWRHLHRAETDTRAAWDRINCPAASRA